MIVLGLMIGGNILDHPGRVTLKTEELFCFVVLSSTIREGDPFISQLG